MTATEWVCWSGLVGIGTGTSDDEALATVIVDDWGALSTTDGCSTHQQNHRLVRGDSERCAAVPEGTRPGINGLGYLHLKSELPPF